MTPRKGRGMSVDFDRAVWRKASRSGGNGGNCVEVAQNLPGVAAIRDSKLGASGPVLAVRPDQFAAFTQAIQEDRLS